MTTPLHAHRLSANNKAHSQATSHKHNSTLAPRPEVEVVVGPVVQRGDVRREAAEGGQELPLELPFEGRKAY